MQTGSCLCGAVTYEIHGDIGASYYCHCSRCRKTSGSAFTSNAVISSKDFVVVAGESFLRSFISDEGISRVFCSNCGSPLVVSQGDQMRLRLGSLDTVPATRPQAHLFTASKASWFDICDDLPQHAERPDNLLGHRPPT